jgi:hypothetical protein
MVCWGSGETSALTTADVSSLSLTALQRLWFYSPSGSPAGTSSFDLTVTDSASALPPVSDSYDIKWHFPLEPYHKRDDVHTFVWRDFLSPVTDGAYWYTKDGGIVSQDNPYATEAGSWLPVLKGVADASSEIGNLPGAGEIFQILGNFGEKAADWYSEKNFPTKTLQFTTLEEAWGKSVQHQQTGNFEGPDPKPILDLVPPDLIDDPDGYKKCTHQVVEIVHSRQESCDADVYNNNGFVSNQGHINSDEVLDVTVDVVWRKKK